VAWLVYGVAIAQSSLPEKYGSASAFQDGDRVCFIGDSITAAGIYQQYIELFYATRFPQRKIQYFNCGIGGDTASAIVEAADFRVRHDVLGHSPTVATIMLGMNDINGRLYTKEAMGEDLAARRQAALERYRENLARLVSALTAAGVRVTLLTPSILDDTAVLPGAGTYTGANEALGTCARYVRQAADDAKAGLIEVHAVMDVLNRAEQARNPSFTILGVGQKQWYDRVHPGPGGHLVLAYGFLKAQQVEGRVSKVMIDAVSGEAFETENAMVTNVNIDNGVVAFDVLAGALPVVLPKDARAAFTLVPFEDEFNQELLAVRGLPAGTYRVTIDEQAVGSYSAEQLAAGIGLSGNPKTPQYQQSARAAGIGRVRAELGAKVRHLTTFRYGRSKDGKDPLDDDALTEWLLEKLAYEVHNPPGKGPLASLYTTCLCDLEADGAMEQLHEKLGELLRQACQPVVRQYRVDPQPLPAASP
jgi:lysophospholipase L1-like esterase